MLLAFVMFAGIGCISLLVKKFALDEFGITETAFGQLVLGPALVIGLVAVPAGRLADRWGKAHCVQLGFSLAAVGLWGIPILHHIFRDDLVTGKTAFVLAAAVMGVGSVIAFPAWLALLTSLCEDRQRGTVFGAVSTAQGVGALAGALAGTALYDVRHIVPFVAAAALVTLGALLALVFVRDRAATGRAPGPAEAGFPWYSITVFLKISLAQIRSVCYNLHASAPRQAGNLPRGGWTALHNKITPERRADLLSLNSVTRERGRRPDTIDIIPKPSGRTAPAHCRAAPEAVVFRQISA